MHRMIGQQGFLHPTDKACRDELMADILDEDDITDEWIARINGNDPLSVLREEAKKLPRQSEMQRKRRIAILQILRNRTEIQEALRAIRNRHDIRSFQQVMEREIRIKMNSHTCRGKIINIFLRLQNWCS